MQKPKFCINNSILLKSNFRSKRTVQQKSQISHITIKNKLGFNSTKGLKGRQACAYFILITLESWWTTSVISHATGLWEKQQCHIGMPNASYRFRVHYPKSTISSIYVMTVWGLRQTCMHKQQGYNLDKSKRSSSLYVEHSSREQSGISSEQKQS